MIKGLGVDITSIERIENILEARKEHFLKRVFTVREAAYCMAMSRPAVHLAGRFAAKEAVKKAAGARRGWTDIEIINDNEGKPEVRLKNQDQGLIIHISISHSDDYAIAFVTVEENKA